VRGALLFVVLVIADRLRRNRVMLQQLVRVARVFAGDEVHVFQNLKRTVRDVCKVADRRRNKIKSSGHKRRQDYKINRLVLSICNPV